MALTLGLMRHILTLELGTQTSDGAGGFTSAWTPLNPSRAWAQIQTASQRALERVASNTVISQASHIVTLRYHPEITTQCRVTWTDRAGNDHVASVVDVDDQNEDGDVTVLLVAEIVS